MDYEAPDLHAMDRSDLWELMRSGHPIDPAALDDSEYLGVSIGLPAWVDQLAWKTFVKSFHRDPASGQLRGWNLRLVQRGLAGPHEAKRRRGVPHSFGHFQVCRLADYGSPGGLENGLLLDYGRGGNAPWDPVGLLRDPIVALQPDSADLLLGWTWLDFGVARLKTPSFFTLQRLRPLSQLARPTRYKASEDQPDAGLEPGLGPVSERPLSPVSRLGLWPGLQTGNLVAARSPAAVLARAPAPQKGKELDP